MEARTQKSVAAVFFFSQNNNFMVFDVKRSPANAGMIQPEDDIVQVEFKLINSVELDSTLTSDTPYV